METLTGTVTNLNRSTHTSGGGRDSDVTTTHVATFQLSGRTVRLADREPLIINEGDEIIVAGKQSKGGLFKSSVYRNITQGVHGGMSGKLATIIGSIFLCTSCFICGLSMLTGDAAYQFGCFFPVFIVPSILGGVLLYSGFKQRKAWKAVA